MTSILHCLEFCGRQGLPLRGHRDDGKTVDETKNPGNFKALLKLTSRSDEVLANHLKECTLNASCLSKTAENDLLECVNKYIQAEIVKNIKNQVAGPYYGIMADEVRDISNWEQLGIALRFIKDGKPVEKLFTYVQCDSTTGESIADEIISEISKAELDPLMCRSQTYDGTGNMAGCQKGAAEKFKEKTGNAHAPYYHCASHDLNLAISKSLTVQDVRNMIDAMQSLGVFFMYSPKRQRVLEAAVANCNEKGLSISKLKIKPLCQTRWVERHTSLEDLHMLYPAVLDTLDLIASNRDRNWGSQAV